MAAKVEVNGAPAGEREAETMRALREVSNYLGGWREMIAELEDFCSEPVRLKAMVAALDQIDRLRPYIRRALAQYDTGA